MNGKPVLFTTVFQLEAKREQIFWIIIDISMFAVEFEIAKEKLHCPNLEMSWITQRQETAAQGFSVYRPVWPKTSVLFVFKCKWHIHVVRPTSGLFVGSEFSLYLFCREFYTIE